MGESEQVAEQLEKLAGQVRQGSITPLELAKHADLHSTDDGEVMFSAPSGIYRVSLLYLADGQPQANEDAEHEEQPRGPLLLKQGDAFESIQYDGGQEFIPVHPSVAEQIENGDTLHLQAANGQKLVRLMRHKIMAGSKVCLYLEEAQ